MVGVLGVCAWRSERIVIACACVRARGASATDFDYDYDYDCGGRLFRQRSEGQMLTKFCAIIWR
jgi:hypothetical protein